MTHTSLTSFAFQQKIPYHFHLVGKEKQEEYYYKLNRQKTRLTQPQAEKELLKIVAKKSATSNMKGS